MDRRRFFCLQLCGQNYRLNFRVWSLDRVGYVRPTFTGLLDFRNYVPVGGSAPDRPRVYQ